MVSYFLAYMLLIGHLSFCQECIPGFLENVDFPGSDITFLFSPSVEHCQQLCTQEPSCLFFSFNRADSNFQCYLKSSSSGKPESQIPLQGVTSGYSLKPCNPNPTPCLRQVFRNVDFFGADYTNLFTANLEECQRLCTGDPRCQFYTFITGDFPQSDIRYRCFLKFSFNVPRIPAIERKPGVISGFSRKPQLTQQIGSACQTQLFQDTDFPGNDFLELKAVSPEYCQFLCSVQPLCTYFSFSSNNFGCILKNNPNSLVVQSKRGVTSGIPSRFCRIDESWLRLTYEGVDFFGSDFRSEVVRNADDCQQTCTQNPNCQFFTYITESFPFPDIWRRCFLKRVITIPSPPEVKKLANAVSGFALKNC
uniref:Apple domain-containing protein n=1 Tax=Cyprinodon variegatus TaxID=28743 RepID=A0A3Q2FWU5_CYPVA